MKKGKLIVIEGNDGSGKATQLALLEEYFNKENIHYSSFDFPQYGKTFFGDFVGHFLTGKYGHTSRINPYLAMFPYAGDRWQAKAHMYRALEEGKIVVCNRYAPSIAYQMAKIKPSERKEYLQWAETLEYDIFGIPREDLVIFLHVSSTISHALVSKKSERNYLNGKSRDQYEESVNYLRKVEKMYLLLNKLKKNWILINCMENNTIMTKEQIHGKILKTLKYKSIIP